MTTFTRRALFGAGTLMLAAPALVLRAPRAMAAEAPVYAENGVAIDGSDPVAYFAEQGPVLGQPSETVDWNGARWHFANAQNAKDFAARPNAYAPQFGGYCAFAASRGYLAPTIPEAWTVYKGELFLNANLRARELWLAELDENIARGRENWPGILG